MPPLGTIDNAHGGRTTLPIRPRPYADESAHGFLARVAFANGYETPRQLWKALCSEGMHTQIALQAALQLSQNEYTRLWGPYPRYWCFQDNLCPGLCKADYLHDVFRWCPQCLSLAPYLRSIWAIKFCVVCPDHGTYLTDTCPSCHCTQKIERSNRLRCACGQSLTASKTETAPSELLKFQQAFITCWNIPSAGMFPQLSPNQWIRFLLHFSTLTAPDRKGKTGQIAGLQHLSIAVSAVQHATQILTNWPCGFHALLTKTQAQSDISFSLSRTFGKLYRWLYDDLSDQEFSFLREAFETYLQEHWWGLVCQRNMRIKPTSKGTQRTTLREAATSAGVSPTRIKQLHLNGLVEATTVAHSNGRHSWTLPTSAVELLARLASDGISLKAASEHLVLPRHRIRELIEAGLIHPRLCPKSHGSSTWLLSREELDQLGCSVGFNAAAALPCNEGESTVSIVQILRGWRLAAGAFPALIAALSANQVKGVGAKPRGIPLGAMRIPVRGLRAWLRQWERSHMQDMSIATAARILGIKEQVAYELVRSGLLHAHPMPSSHSRRIAKASIEHFQNTYVSAVEIGKKMKMSTTSLIEHLNVQPVAGPHVNGCRQYFLKRDDVSKFNEINSQL